MAVEAPSVEVRVTAVLQKLVGGEKKIQASGATVSELIDNIDANHPGAITAPMVGTIYLAPEPGAAPYISQGGTVLEGDTLFIIEAMKTMNPVRAPRFAARASAART